MIEENQGVTASSGGRSAALRAEPRAGSQAKPAVTNASDGLACRVCGCFVHSDEIPCDTPYCVLKVAEV